LILFEIAIKTSLINSQNEKIISSIRYLCLNLHHQFIVFIKMEYIKTEIEGVWILQPKVYDDARGYFFEVFKQSDFEQHIGNVNFIQDNESKSTYGVLRGLHYQKGDLSQAKLVRVISGKVLDVAVDIRKNSPTFGKHVMVELSGENKRQFFIPRGFAHGFLVMSDEAVFTYKVDNLYSPQNEASIRFDDPDLAIQWPVNMDEVLTSPKDLTAVSLKDAVVFE
jgi:dTDP-4-dehydrorhamnose 3,5-epimerase